MENYEEKLKNFIKENNIQAEHIHFETSVHTVEEACAAVNAQPDDFVKTICMISNDKVICAIVLGSFRASTSRVETTLKIERPNLATPEQALEKTGYIVGGTPPFGYDAIFLIDDLVMQKEVVYAGGGTPEALIKISPNELQRVNQGIIARVRK